MMNAWGQFPFVRILIALLAGMLLQLEAGIHFPLYAVTVVVLIVFLMHLLARIRTLRLYHYSYWLVVSIQLALLMLGNVLAYNALDIHDVNHYTHFMDHSDAMIIHLQEPPIEKDKTLKALADVKAVSISGEMKKSCGCAIVYFQKDSLTALLNYGDELMVKNKFQPIPPSRNPDDFDFRRYAMYQNIYATAYLREGDYKLLPVHETNFIFKVAYWLRGKSIYAIEKYIPSAREAAVTEAMVIGDRDNLSFGVERSFANAGVIHIIVVAGLHVGILYLLLQKVFFFLDTRKRTRLLKSILIILLIWVFALLTGLSGPVLRAAMMFSFFTIGKSLDRNTNNFNILACSALILLLLNPLFITQPGFQLSYCAVFGIGALSHSINGWFYHTNKIVDYVWKIVASSLSAQVAILPFTLHYFNQFPTYFLLANIVVIPIAFVIIYLGIALIVLQWIPPVAFVIGKIAQGVVYLMNEFILRIEQLPFAVLHTPEFTVVQSVLIALSLIFIIQFLISRERRMFVVSLISILILFVIRDFNFIQHTSQKSFIVYSIPGKSRFEFSENGKAFFFQSVDTPDERERYYFSHHWQLGDLGVVSKFSSEELDRQEDTMLNNHLYESNSFFQFHNYKVAFINQTVNENPSSVKVKVDAVIVSGNPKLRLKNLVGWIDAGIIIFDSSNSSYKVQRWEKDATGLGISTYDVQHQGAFIQQL